MKLKIMVAEHYPKYVSTIETFETEAEAYKRLDEVSHELWKQQNAGKIDDYQLEMYNN